MKQLILLLSITISSSLAFSKPGSSPANLSDSEIFGKSISHSENWKQFLAASGKSVPPFFKGEFTKEADKHPFPSVSFRKDKLTFRDENGNQISVEVRKNGKVFLNDQAFEIRPLDSLANELDRVESTYLHNNSNGSILNFVFPMAFAASKSRGVALASYVVSSGWTSQQCGEDSLSAEQKENCPQTASAMLISDKQSEPAKFFPIELSCPATEAGGTLDLISKNTDGLTNRMRVTYSNYNPISVEESGAAKGEALHKIIAFDLRVKNNSIDQEWANELVVKANAIKTNVCEGPASNRQRYLAALAKNKSIFINASRDQDSDDGSDSGNSQQAL